MREKIFTKEVLVKLGRKELDFINELEKDIFFSTGKKISKSEIISTTIDILDYYRISGYGVHSPLKLKENILSQIKLNYSDRSYH